MDHWDIVRIIAVDIDVEVEEANFGVIVVVVEAVVVDVEVEVVAMTTLFRVFFYSSMSRRTTIKQKQRPRDG